MKSKTKKVAKPAVSPFAVSAGIVKLSLSVKTEGLEPIFGAAYLMMDRAFVVLSGDRAKTIVVSLRPKNPGATPPRALGEAFVAELASQKVRWAIARNNQPVREYIAEQAVLIASGAIPPPAAPAAAEEPAAEQLTDDQRAEIERLIAEVESEIKTMNDKKVALDPKGVKASWEEAQEKKA